MSEKKKPKQDRDRDYRKLLVEYLNGEMSIQTLAEMHGVSPATLRNHASRNGWAKKREEHRQDVALKAAEAAEETAVERHKEAVEAAYKLRLRIVEELNLLLDSARESGFKISVDDMVKITRLERDLDMPGWMKSEEEKQPFGTFTLAGYFGEHLDRTRKERQAALEQGATSGPSLARPDDAQSGFMAPEDGDETEDELGA